MRLRPSNVAFCGATLVFLVWTAFGSQWMLLLTNEKRAATLKSAYSRSPSLAASVLSAPKPHTAEARRATEPILFELSKVPEVGVTGQKQCGRTRGGKHLLFAAHSGFGNQEVSLRKALLLAYVLNRSLLLPPLLQQGELSFGPPEKRCANRSELAGLQQRAERLYVQKAAQGLYEPLGKVFDFSELGKLGVRTNDFLTFTQRASDRMPRTVETLAAASCIKEGGEYGRCLRE